MVTAWPWKVCCDMEKKFSLENVSATFFEPMSSSLSFCNKALSELNLIENVIHTDGENDILNNHTFAFYKLSVKYCFNNEYCKIFANKIHDESANSASIIHINNYLHQKLGNEFESAFIINIQLLSSIAESSFFKNQLLLNQKNEVGCTINQLNYKEVQTGFQHLNTAAKVIKNCMSHFDLDYNLAIPNINTSTINFVMDHSVFKKFYLDNHLRALD